VPEIGSIKKKKKKGRKPPSSEVVSAYSEEGKSRQRRGEALTRLCWIFGIALTLVGVALILTFAFLGKL